MLQPMLPLTQETLNDIQRLEDLALRGAGMGALEVVLRVQQALTAAVEPFNKGRAANDAPAANGAAN